MRIFLSELNEDNWLEAANLSVSEKQKDVFPIPNVYWLGISRYEEHTTLYAITLDKNLIDAYFNRGQLIMQEKPKLALDDFVKAVALDSKFIDAYYSIAVIQKKLGQYKEAVSNLDKIIEIEPHAVNAKALKKLILTKYLK